MTLSIQQMTKRLSRHSRRALITLFLAGSVVSSIAFAADDSTLAATAVNPAEQAAQVEELSSDHSLDYWIFSDDYCGWASAEAFANPYSIDPFATEPARCDVASAANPSLTSCQQPDTMAEDLAELAKSEPVDVTAAMSLSVAGVPESKLSGSLSGSSPVIVTIAEGYLPYDMNRSDQISLRMYPITVPQFNYVGADRMSANHRAGAGPLDCLGHGVIWSEDVMPAQTVETKPQVDYMLLLTDAWHGVDQLIADAAQDVSEQSNARSAAVARSIVAAIQPDSNARQAIAPIRLGKNVGDSFLAMQSAATSGLQNATRNVASWKFETPASQVSQSVELATAGEKLLVRAGVEANALDCATAGVADVANSMSCPVERLEVAAQPPATYQVAAVGVAAATLRTPQEPQGVREGISRAEAIATACDSTAATLERLALALRKAGDSVVRVARASAEGGSDLR